MFYAVIVVASLLTEEPISAIKTDPVFKTEDECHSKIKDKIPQMSVELAQRLPGVPFAIYVKCAKADTI